MMRLRTWHRTALLLAVLCAAAGWLWALCSRDPRVAFLSSRTPAAWIVFPSVADLKARVGTDMETTFRREFTLPARPSQAVVSIRALKAIELTINGEKIAAAPEPNWKRIWAKEVASSLRAGTNVVEAVVRNNHGPGALWLALDTDALRLTSDPSWDVSCAGSAWRKAVPASSTQAILRTSFFRGGETAIGSVMRVWPFWLAIAALAVGLLVSGRLAFQASAARSDAAVLCARAGFACLGLTVAVWAALFFHNLSLLPAEIGFDAHDHLEYIELLEQHWRLPLPSQGMQMFQPPLYYVLAASLIAAFNLTIHEPAGILLLRLLQFAGGLTHITLVFLSLRLLFPRRLIPQLVGLGIGAFLPMHLYLTHYVTNETFAGLFVSASVFLCLRLLKSPMTTLAPFIVLGAVMGAAILTKFTAVLVVPCVLGALAIQLLAQGERWPRLLAKIALTGATALVLSGWHYARVASHAGHLVIGGWDASVGVAWWQEPGFRTSHFFTTFGQALVHPLFSGTLSFADGLYSTMWGDSLCAGAADLAKRAPWNYDWMCAGYLLALVPTVLILAGALEASWNLIRHGGVERFLLVSIAAAIGLGLVYLTLTVPCHATVKSFYGLVALVPLCFFGATGWERITRGRATNQLVLGTILLVCAASNLASFWVNGNAGSTHLCRGLAFYSAGDRDQAASEFAKAVAASPADGTARRSLARSLDEHGQAEEALRNWRLAVESEPRVAANRVELGLMLARMGEQETAISELRQAIQNDPDYPLAYQVLSGTLAEMGRGEEATTTAREGLAIAPGMPEMHFALGMVLLKEGEIPAASNRFRLALALRPNWTAAHFQLGLIAFQTGDFKTAAQHFQATLDQFPFDSRAQLLLGSALLELHDRAAGVNHLQQAVRMAPQFPEALNALAWVRATCAEASLRDGAQALELAQKACQQSPQKTPRFIATLAAAYAEAGLFAEASKSAREALALAHSDGDAALETAIQHAIALYDSGRPYHEAP